MKIVDFKLPDIRPTQPDLIQDFTPVQVDVVKHTLWSMQEKSSPMDYLPYRIFRQQTDILLPIITILSNMSFSTGKFPISLKVAQISPLLKKPSLMKPNLQATGLYQT